MKKIILSLLVCSSLVMFTSCKKEKDRKQDCTVAMQKVESTLAAYRSNVREVANCKNLKASLKELSNRPCFNDLPASVKQNYQAMITSLPCN